MNENRNLLLAVLLSAAVLFGWEYFIARPQLQSQQAIQAQQALLTHQEKKQSAANTATPQAQAATAHMSREQALKLGGARVAIDTPTVDGSLLLKGARFDDLRLKKYRETFDPKSPEIVLLSPESTSYPYFAMFGWTVDPAAHLKVPDNAAQWKETSGAVLSPGHPITLSWDNGQGLVFTRTIAVDDQYLFTVDDSVSNKTGATVTLYPYAYVARDGVPASTHYSALHEGFVGIVNGDLNDPSYDDVKPEKPPVSFHSNGGWVGITDKYWMAAVVPPQNQTFDGAYRASQPTGVKTYQADYRLNAISIAPGASAAVSQRLFAGAKLYSILEDYETRLGIPRFRYAIDWGWFFFFTKPMFLLLHLFNGYTGNFGVAILLLTVVIRLLFFPLANTQFKSMSRMKKLQPQVEALKTRFADDRVRQQQEMMELYKREKVNPVSGCLPVVIQIPVFFSLYKVLIVTIEMRHAPFVGWVHDLSAPDPTSIINLFGLLPFDPHVYLPGFLAFVSIGIWPILMGLTQWLQTKMNPAPADPVQARMFAFMPVVFTMMLASFPVGLVIYYTWSNLLSLAQQYFIMRRQGVEIHLFNNLKIPALVQRLARTKPKTEPGE
jgi:YidC/Oxa1 family membrane protein insertase